MKNPSRPSYRILRMSATEEKVALKETQIREKVAAGEFPKPIKLSASGRAIGFLEHELDDYLAKRIAERDLNIGHSPAEQARIEASREGRRKAREARHQNADPSEKRRHAS